MAWYGKVKAVRLAWPEIQEVKYFYTDVYEDKEEARTAQAELMEQVNADGWRVAFYGSGLCQGTPPLDTASSSLDSNDATIGSEQAISRFDKRALMNSTALPADAAGLRINIEKP